MSPLATVQIRSRRLSSQPFPNAAKRFGYTLCAVDSDAPTQYPDDVFTIPDEASPTDAAFISSPRILPGKPDPEAVPNLFTGLNALSGFTERRTFELSAAVTDVERRTALNTDRIHFVQVDEEASIVPFTATYGQDGHAIVIRPSSHSNKVPSTWSP